MTSKNPQEEFTDVIPENEEDTGLEEIPEEVLKEINNELVGTSETGKVEDITQVREITVIDFGTESLFDMRPQPVSSERVDATYPKGFVPGPANLSLDSDLMEADFKLDPAKNVSVEKEVNTPTVTETGSQTF